MSSSNGQFCDKCGAVVNSNAEFCDKCGKAVNKSIDTEGTNDDLPTLTRQMNLQKAEHGELCYNEAAVVCPVCKQAYCNWDVALFERVDGRYICEPCAIKRNKIWAIVTLFIPLLTAVIAFFGFGGGLDAIIVAILFLLSAVGALFALRFVIRFLGYTIDSILFLYIIGLLPSVAAGAFAGMFLGVYIIVVSILALCRKPTPYCGSVQESSHYKLKKASTRKKQKLIAFALNLLPWAIMIIIALISESLTAPTR